MVASKLNRFPPPQKGMIRAAPMAAIPDLLKEFGIAPAPLLKKCGLPEDIFLYPDSTMPFATMGRLLKACVRESGCAHFGLLVGQRASPSALGAVGFLMKNSPDVATAINEFVLNFDLHDRGATLFLKEEDGSCLLVYEIYQHGMEAVEQIVDGAMAVGLNLMRSLCGPDWLADEILFRRDTPEDVSPYKNFFQAPLQFNARQTALRFDTRWLANKIQHADPVLHQHFLQNVQDLIRHSPEDYRSKVYQAVLLLLGSKRCNLDGLADYFSLHPRTLNRRLKEASTSFRELHNEARHATACQLLQQTRSTIANIAELLGYSNETAFNRAFSHWEGTPPAKWRRQMQATSG